jgi:hypothetical protein
MPATRQTQGDQKAMLAHLAGDFERDIGNVVTRVSAAAARSTTNIAHMARARR